MILCARSTSRSSEKNTKRRSRSESMWKLCWFYSGNNKILWQTQTDKQTDRQTQTWQTQTDKQTQTDRQTQTWQTHFRRKLWRAQRFVGFIFLIVLAGCWLAEQANSDHVIGTNQFQCICHKPEDNVSCRYSHLQKRSRKRAVCRMLKVLDHWRCLIRSVICSLEMSCVLFGIWTLGVSDKWAHSYTSSSSSIE